MAEETLEKKLENVSDDNSITEKVSNAGKNARRWMLTINNPEETDEDMIKYIEGLEHIKYSIFQREKGHLEETEHFQMFLVFSIGKRFSTIKSLFPKAHIEACKGTNLECMKYCSKEDTRVSGYYEIGVFQEERGRSDIKTLHELVKSGATDKQIRELLPTAYIRYDKYVERERQKMLAEEFDNKIKENFISVYIYGVTQTGKTTDLFTGYGNKAYFVSDYLKNPWDAYRNQDIVVMDDYNSQFNFDMIKKYIDIFPIELASRYNNKYGNYTKVFIVSNKHINFQYAYERTHESDKWNSFRKRVHFVLHYENNKIYVEDATKPLEKLRQLLPKHMIEKLDYTRVGFTAPTTERKEVVHQFEIIDDDNLPF